MGFRDMCPRPARSWCEGSSIRVPSPLVTTRHGRAARVGAAATAAAMRGAGVAGEPLRRVDAPTPLLLRSPPLAKVQSHSHHLLRQVLFAYLAVPPILEELVVIAVLHHSLLNCVVYTTPAVLSCASKILMVPCKTFFSFGIDVSCSAPSARSQR